MKLLPDDPNDLFFFFIIKLQTSDSDPLAASSVRLCAQNSQREGRSPVFKWDVWIDVGSTTQTAGSLRNPETRRTPSYICTCQRKADLSGAPVEYSSFRIVRA